MGRVLKIGCGGIIVIAVLLGIIAALASSGGGKTPTEQSPDFVVRVSGTEGLRFSGSIMTVAGNGQSVSQSIEGRVPAEYPLSARLVSVSFQKQTEQGAMKVQIMKGPAVKAESETSASYGVVTAATQ